MTDTPHHRPRLFLRSHSPRAKRLKLVVTASLVAAVLINHHFATAAAFGGNLLWLWADFE